MKTWVRASHDTICGGPCHRQIRRGEPLLVLTIVGIEKRRRRCASCAGEKPPEDLPPLVEPSSFTPMSHIRTGATALPFDFKMAQAGREVGADDE